MKKRYNVILISPISGIYEYIYKVIPVSLLSICEGLDETKYRLIIIDQKVKGWEKKLNYELKKEILLVAITAFTGVQSKYALKISKEIKKNYNYPILIGGIHATSCPEQTLKESSFDYIIQGDGKESFRQLLEILSSNLKINKKEVSGLGYKRKSNLFINPIKKKVVNFPKKLPYHLINIENYLDKKRKHLFYVLGAKGCIYNCTFCYNSTLNEKKWFPREISFIIDEIEFLYKKYLVKNFFIIDDSFFISKKRALDFSKEILKRNLMITWACEANFFQLQKLSNQELKQLIKSGLNWISIGVESGSKKIRTYFNKSINKKSLIDFNKRVSAFPIFIRYNFITGTFLETKNEVKQTTQLISKLLNENEYAMTSAVQITVPYPKTKYFKDCLNKGLENPKIMNDWSNYDPFKISVCLPWLNKKNKKMFEFIMYSSNFLDSKFIYYFDKKKGFFLIKYLLSLYQKFLMFRFNRQISIFALEVYFFKIFHNFIEFLIEKEFRNFIKLIGE